MTIRSRQAIQAPPDSHHSKRKACAGIGLWLGTWTLLLASLSVLAQWV